jgi:hypothetical protein
MARVHGAGAARATVNGGAARGSGATLSYGSDLTGARETARKAWRGSPARGRWCGTTRRSRRRRDVASVDIGIGGIGHGGDGSDRAMVTLDSSGRDAARSGRRHER